MGEYCGPRELVLDGQSVSRDTDPEYRPQNVNKEVHAQTSEPLNPPDELAQHFSKNRFRTNCSSFSFESSESYRVFNNLHDSNSIFWSAGIGSRLKKSPKLQLIRS